MKTVVALAAVLAVASAEVYFKEEFGPGWEDRWIVSEKKSDYGKWIVSPGQFYGDEARDTGLKTSEDARFYAISSRIEKPFSNKDKDFVVQFTVKHEQKIDCGGGYLKLMPSTVDPKDFHGESPYNIMFGPDICGASKRTHLIFNYKGENHLRKDDLKTESDELTHLYTLIVHPDQTYEVKIDEKTVAEGNLVDDWDFLPPKEIKDPSQSKPADWVDEAEIPDPEDKKPEGWDDIPEFIPDPDAEKPEDWDDEDDGEWEPPTIPNPEYKGEWKPRMIPNPEYKGEWVHPMIPNPDYHEDNGIYAFDDFGVVGIDIWQVKSGTIFDNIIITDSEEEAKEHAEETWAKLKVEEKKQFDADREEKKKKADEERAKRDAEIKEMEDEDQSEDDLDADADDEDAKKKEKLETLKKQEEKHDEL